MAYSLPDAINRIQHFEAQPHPPPASWYGLDRPLRAMLDFPDWLPLLAVTSHGPSLTDDPGLQLRQSSLPAFVDRASIRDCLHNTYGRPAFVTGSLYWRFRQQHDIRQADDARGTLAFPTHSTHHVIACMDWESYAASLQALPAQYQPVTACVYWKDILLGRHESFLRHGIPVVTAGHMFDPEFISNIYGHISRARFTCGNAVGTHALLSLEMGIPYFDFGPDATYDHSTGGDVNSPSGVFSDFDIYYKEKKEFFDLVPKGAENLPVISPELSRYVDAKLGKNDETDIPLLKRIATIEILKHSKQIRDIFQFLKKNTDLFQINIVEQ